MFVKGELSKYLNRRTIEVAERYFPGMRLEVVKGAGHWGECRVGFVRHMQR